MISAAAESIDQTGYTVSQGWVCTHQLLPPGGLGVPGIPVRVSPRSAISPRLCGSSRGGVALPLGLEGVASGVPNTEQTIGYMRNRRTVKIAYWGLIFFCDLLILFGVSRSLGYPSGGLYSQRCVI